MNEKQAFWRTNPDNADVFEKKINNRPTTFKVICMKVSNFRTHHTLYCRAPFCRHSSLRFVSSILYDINDDA